MESGQLHVEQVVDGAVCNDFHVPVHSVCSGSHVRHMLEAPCGVWNDVLNAVLLNFSLCLLSSSLFASS